MASIHRSDCGCDRCVRFRTKQSEAPKRLADSAIQLIEKHGLDGLGHTDGCPCLVFDVKNCSVHISCHKSAHTITVSSGSIDYDHDDLVRVMDVVKREFAKCFGYAPDSYTLQVVP